MIKLNKILNFKIRIFFYIKRELSYFINRKKLKINRVYLEENIKINGKFYIKNYGEIYIKSNVYINSSASSNLLGGSCFSALVTGKSGILEIGKNVGISNTSIVAYKKITIKDNVTIGNGCKIFDTDFHPLNAQERLNDINLNVRNAPIEINENVFLGTGVVVMKGVIIGKNSIIGAHSVVVKSIPSNEIWAGNPAKKIKNIDE